MDDLINQADRQKYQDAFDAHPFRDMAVLVSWFLGHAKTMVKQKTAGRSNPSWTVVASDLKSELEPGDVFFSQLFEDRSPFPFSGMAGNSQPLSNAIGTVYESIWELPTTHTASTIDDAMLVRYIESQLGQAVATVQSLSNLQYWERLVDRFDQSDSFYHGLLYNIPQSLIERIEPELQFQNDRNNVLRGVYYVDKRVTEREFHRAYVQQMEKLANSPSWKMLKTLTNQAEYAHFSPEWAFREDLILRLPTKSWVTWTDKLYWPFTQAISFFAVRDLAKMEECFDELSKAAKTLNTPYSQLILIALSHYFHRLIHQITRNLHHTAQDASPTRVDVRLPIREKASRQYDHWKTAGRKDSLERVFGFIFADPDHLTPSLLRGIFDWVADQDQGTWSLSPAGTITAPDIKDLYEVFLGNVKRDTRLRSDILAATHSGELTWPKAELIFSIYLQNETDEALRSTIVNKMLAWLESETFGWNHNLEYNNLVFAQASRLAYLIYKGPDPESTINTIIEQYSYWHEGWPARLPRSITQSKELYTLIVGIFICYNYFDDGDRMAGQRLFDRFLRRVLDQYRQASNGDRKYYCPAIHLLIHVHLQFGLPDFPHFMNEVISKVQNIEEILQLGQDWIETASLLHIPLDPGIVGAILTKIDSDYWIVQEEIKATGNLSPFRVYEAMYSKIVENFRPANS
jgi:hypothetical protein